MKRIKAVCKVNKVEEIFKQMNVAGKWFKVAIKSEETEVMKKFGHTAYSVGYVIVSANSIWMGNIGEVGVELDNEGLKAVIPTFKVIEEVRMTKVGTIDR
jgi:hypothetical protein